MSREVQDTLLKQLKNPFDPKFVKWRIGSTNSDKTKGQAVAYIDVREVKKRLDDVCGLAGWQDKYVPLDGGLICELSIFVEGNWITKSDAAGNTKVEPIKGGASDALKRAASTWGIGRYLYYLPKVWVPIRQQGKSYVLTQTPELPEWALPNSNIERWEDIAEMEADMTSGEDEQVDADALIDNVDRIRSAQTSIELDEVIAALAADDKVILANQINAKRRVLLHEEKINSNSGAGRPA
jgi:hypothetical protein